MTRKRLHAATTRPLAALTVGTVAIVAAAYIAVVATAWRLAMRRKRDRELRQSPNPACTAAARLQPKELRA